MSLGIPIIDGIINMGTKVLDKIWMDKDEKEKLEFNKEELKQVFDLKVRELQQAGHFKDIEEQFKEYQAQRDFANDQFGTAQAMAQFGWVGKLIMLGRASIRWVITGGSMFFTWKILNAVLTNAVVNALAAGTLGGSAPYIVGLLICLVVGIPVFYVSGVSVEKIMKVRNKL